MTTFDIRLDPSGLAVNRTELALNSTAIVVDEAGVDWGDAAIQEYLADAQVGSAAVGRRWPNRTVKIPLIVRAPNDSVTFNANKEQLMQKVGQIQREGFGWLQRQSGLFADIVGATLTFPDRYGERFGWENGVVLQLECLPDFYGNEVTLDSISSSSGVVDSVLKLSSSTAVIDGAQDARCRIVVTDTSGHDQSGIWWGVRSQYYDNASTAKLVLEAEALTKVNGSSAHTHAGMSGGTTVMNTLLPAETWAPILVTDLSAGTQLTHRGSYRVVARAFSSSAAPQLRFQWGVGAAASFVTNDAVALPSSNTAYELDLGIIRIDAPPVGNLAWRGAVQAQVPIADSPIEIDRLTFVPVAEASGALNASPGVQAGAIEADGGPSSIASSGSGQAWTIALPSSVTLANQTSQLLAFTDFGFSIPSGATIQGIEFFVGRQASGSPVLDVTVKLLKAGTAVGNNEASAVPWPSSSGSPPYGGLADLWGTTWAPSDINNSGFGIEISATSAGNAVATVFASAAIYYTIGTAFGATQARVLYADESIEVRTEGAFNTANGTVFNEITTEGDLPRIPASGLESRPCELLVVTSEGNLVSSSAGSPSQPSGALDSFTVQVKYRPCWVFAP